METRNLEQKINWLMNAHFNMNVKFLYTIHFTVKFLYASEYAFSAFYRPEDHILFKKETIPEKATETAKKK